MQEKKISLNIHERQAKQGQLPNEEALLEKELKDIYLACNTLSVFSPGKEEWQMETRASFRRNLYYSGSLRR